MNEIKNDIIIYGAGNMGKAAITLVRHLSGRVIYVLDKNPFLCGQKLHDVTITAPDQVNDIHKDECDVLVAMTACKFKEIHDYLSDLGYKNIFLAGDYINEHSAGRFTLINYWKLSDNELKTIRSSNFFGDDISQKYFLYSAEWFFDRSENSCAGEKIDRDKYFPDFIRNALSSDEVMIDSGILSGEYIRKFMAITSGNGKTFGYSLHPSVPLADDIIKYCKISDCELSDSCRIVVSSRIGLMEPFTESTEQKYEAVTIDEEFKDIRYSYLRIYSMSPVYPILLGAGSTIKKYRPVIAVNIGHFHDDFIFIPRYLKNELENYTLYFRIHSYQGCDCILYALPNEKIIGDKE